ncbi:MFS transporter [Neorhizobium sp. R1-B]|uniref:MFS transporter n=1 Tax=Neorhizobium sp. R1-B TaxID=2485162 RepID=UPI00106463D6|nr:MFS transporter [Neorhizobium sp. R1-B]TDX82367.1 MFS transporter [Neorhizobium sp. R1-B]
MPRIVITDTESGVLQDIDTSWSRLLRGRDGAMLALISSGIGLHAFNQFAIVAALPPAAREIGGTDYFSWAYTLYFLGSIAGGTGAAAFRDRIGVKASLMISALLFAVGGLFALAAPAFSWIMAGRLLQGVADGLVVAICYSLIPANFPSALIAKVFAVEAIVWAVAAIAGPLAGGLLTEAYSWRAAFLAVAPFVLLLPVLTLVARPRVTEAAPMPLSFATIGLCLAASFVLSLSSVATDGAMQAVAIAAGAGLFLPALKLDGKIGARLFPAGAFRLGSVLGNGFWVLFLMSASHSVGSVYLAVMIDAVFGFRPAVVGYLVVSMALTWSVVAVAASRIVALGARHAWMRSGALFQLLGFLALAASFAYGSLGLLLLGQIAIGTGFGLAWASINQAAMEAAETAERDLASALLPTISTAGYAVGAGLAGMIATATGLVSRLDGGEAGGPAIWLYGTAAAGALLTFLFGFGVRLKGN